MHSKLLPLSALLPVIVGGALLVPRAGAATATTIPAIPAVSLNKAALGSGGGKFCDAVRANFADALGVGASSALTDPAKTKAYFENAAKVNAKLIASAPGDIKPALVVTQKVSQGLLDALKKANYVFAKLDPKVMTALGNPDPATKAAQAKVNTYLTKTCHIDITKALSSAH